MVQWDKTQVENFGLIKMDILGLNTLDLIDLALVYIKERHHKTIDILRLPLNDARVLKAFGRGDTKGIFQFAGGGMQKLLKELAMGGPLDFNDLCATTALFRPGPLDAGLCDRYVRVKQGAATPYYEHPALEECLSDTFGVIVYQEQVMRVCRVLAGMTPGEADGVRKSMGKKDAVKMAEYKEMFVAGAEKSGMSNSAASTLWETIAGFAGYGFNKSHAAAYTLISWQTMWLNRRKTVKPTDGTTRWRILPSWRGAGQQFYHDFGQHFVKDSTGKILAIYMCTEKTYGRPCQVCDAIRDGAKSAADDFTMKMLKDAGAGSRVLVNAIQLDGPAPTEVNILELAPGATV